MNKTKTQKYINIIPTNIPCSNCGGLLELRKYKGHNNDSFLLPIKLIKKSYYYSEWKFCPKCGSLFYEDKNKIILSDEYKQKIQEDYFQYESAMENLLAS